MSGQSTLMTMLGTQMRHLTQRQTVLSQNIANIDTPGYKAQDLKKLDFSNMAAESLFRMEMRSTNPKHLTGTKPTGLGRTDDLRNPFETSPVGNSVNLEEEMAKISRTGADYQVATNLYKKFTTMYRATLGK